MCFLVNDESLWEVRGILSSFQSVGGIDLEVFI